MISRWLLSVVESRKSSTQAINPAFMKMKSVATISTLADSIWVCVLLLLLSHMVLYGRKVQRHVLYLVVVVALVNFNLKFVKLMKCTPKKFGPNDRSYECCFFDGNAHKHIQQYDMYGDYIDEAGSAARHEKKNAHTHTNTCVCVYAHIEQSKRKSSIWMNGKQAAIVSWQNKC